MILVCLVSSLVLQDYYIAWTVDVEENTGTYTDGVTSPPQKIKNGYLVSSVYTVRKNDWTQSSNVFTCHVWPAGAEEDGKKSQSHSSVTGNSLEC